MLHFYTRPYSSAQQGQVSHDAAGTEQCSLEVGILGLVHLISRDAAVQASRLLD
jgi:hypothetical protein